MKKWQPLGEKVTVLIKDKRANNFLSSLKAEKVYITELSVTDEGIKFKTFFRDLNKIRKIRRKYRAKLVIYPRRNDRIFRWNHATYAGIACWLLVPLICSFFIWSVTVDADTPEREVEITAILDKSKVKPLTLIKKLPDEALIRQMVMKNDPELSWVNISRSGGRYSLKPLPAPIHNINTVKEAGPAHLLAARSGVITHVSVASGERVVMKDSTVRKGDLLVSAFIKQGDKVKVVGAEGSVFADYWLETDFSVPRVVKVEDSGMRKLQIEFAFSKKSESKSAFWKEIDLPVPLNRFVHAGYLQPSEEVEMTLDEESLNTLLIPLLKEKLLSGLSQGAIIKEEKILHVSIDNDTLKGKILFLVNENIAKREPIQGAE